jgi:hypothetical protein
MLSAAPISDEALVADLHRLDVRHLARLQIVPAPNLPPPALIAGLAASEEARLQAALILLFLRQPGLSRYAREAAAPLPAPASDAVQLYYQAAYYLQDELAATLKELIPDWERLPDLFSRELDLPSAALSVDAALQALGERHRQRTGWAYNWSGSYRHHIPLFLRQLKRHARPRETAPKQK